jgi:PEP-CTERM motif
MSFLRPTPRMRALVVAVTAALGVVATLQPGAAEAALVARDLTGDQIADAYYDTTLDISWYAVSNTHFATATAARAWAQGLTVGAASDWRLPQVLPVDGVSYDFQYTNDGSSDRGGAATGTGWGTASEMGHLFYVTLQNIGAWAVNPTNPNSIAPNPAWNPLAHDDGPIDWVAGDVVYIAENVAQPGNYPWAFSFHRGLQYVIDEGPGAGYALAVHAGDVGNLVAAGGNPSVPEPGSLLLSALALMGAASARRWLRSRA